MREVHASGCLRFIGINLGIRQLLLGAIFSCIATVAFAATQPTTVEFNRDIRPILSDRCYACHGPDQANRKSKLRLDIEGGAKADVF